MRANRRSHRIKKGKANAIEAIVEEQENGEGGSESHEIIFEEEIANLLLEIQW